jgi:hypothetical protein
MYNTQSFSFQYMAVVLHKTIQQKHPQKALLIEMLIVLQQRVLLATHPYFTTKEHFHSLCRIFFVIQVLGPMKHPLGFFEVGSS